MAKKVRFRGRMSIRCPVYMDDKDDICGELIRLEYYITPIQREDDHDSWEIIDSTCGHDELLRGDYLDEMDSQICQVLDWELDRYIDSQIEQRKEEPKIHGGKAEPV